MQILDSFQLHGKTAVVTGGSGVLGVAISHALASAGARVAVIANAAGNAERVAQSIRDMGGTAHGFTMDVFKTETVQRCCDGVCDKLGTVDILVNGVGGNIKLATTSPDLSFFDIDPLSIQKVVDLNLMGGVIVPSQVFGKCMVEGGNGGSVINISSMNAIRPLTRIPGYSAAKAAVSNFTQWLAVHLAQEYDPRLRVNAVAPGFFLTDQNRFLLTDEQTGEATPRGKSIIDHTPMGRYGVPEDLTGAVVWLASDASKFVTGVVLPVDGGFSAYSGV